MIGYHVFRSPAALRHLPYVRFMPLTFLGSVMLYGILYDDKAVLAGAGAGYLAFLMAL